MVDRRAGAVREMSMLDLTTVVVALGAAAAFTVASGQR
jgi:hypothetical protein